MIQIIIDVFEPQSQFLLIPVFDFLNFQRSIILIESVG